MINEKAPNSALPAFNMAALAKGTVYAFIIALILNLLIGTIMYLSPLTDSWLNGIATFIFGFSIFCGGTVSSFKAGKKGLFHGVGVGILFLLIALLIGGLMDSQTLTGQAILKKSLLGIVAGALGGMLGVGLSK